jgi:hypothetical protein
MTHKATPEQWALIASDAADCDLHCLCLLELRDRIAVLEAANQQPESIDEEENERRFRACLAAIDNATPEQIRAAVAKASANHFPDATKMVPASAGGLVERVAEVIAERDEPVELWLTDARAAILAVADWLDRCKLLCRGGEVPVRWLREEAER